LFKCEHMLQHGEPIDDSWVDVTRIGLETTPALYEEEQSRADDRRFRSARIVPLDIICSTHIDVVGKLQRYGMKMLTDISGLSPEALAELLGETRLHCDVTSCPVLIVNFSKKAHALWNAIKPHIADTIGFSGNVHLIPYQYAFADAEQFRDLFLQVCITRKELRTIFEPLRDNLDPNTVVCFYTDWYDQFNQEGLVEFYDIYELWHPFLMHPYLDEYALEYLLEDLSVRGIASDAPTLEPPVYYCSPLGPLVPGVKALRESVDGGIALPELSLPRDPFVHIRTICARRLLIESLDLSGVASPTTPLLHGQLALMPLLGDSDGWESVLTRALIQVRDDVESAPQ